MIKQNLGLVIVLISMAVFSLACSEDTQRQDADRVQQIAFGEQVFREKECGKCHATTGMETDTVKVEGLDVDPPDLSSVFLAMDTLFVKKHLQFTELSAMPSIAMTPHEINALTQYVASLHALANADPDLTEADGKCPVCGAPVHTSKALTITYEGKTFYLECPDCKIVFERDPTWHSKSGYL
jgi:YHS domain-containing protein